MATIRVEKTREFVVMSNRHLREREMSLKAKGLLSLMLSLPEDWDYSIAGLCVICKESQTAIRSTLKELEDFKYLRRERRQNEKGQFVYEYTVYEIPYTGNQHTGETHTDNAHTENAQTENRTQQSIKKQNIKKQNIEDSIYIGEFENILNNTVVNKELRQLYLEYIEMRQTINAPMTERGLKMLIQRCERLAAMDVELQKALVEAAIINNWKNVYLPNEQDVQNNTTLASLKRFYS